MILAAASFEFIRDIAFLFCVLFFFLQVESALQSTALMTSPDVYFLRVCQVQGRSSSSGAVRFPARPEDDEDEDEDDSEEEGDPYATCLDI